MYGLINVFASQQFLQFSMAVMCFVIGLIACNELKIAQIAFYGLSRTLMSKNVNNDVRKDSPFPNILLMTPSAIAGQQIAVLKCRCKPYLHLVVCEGYR